MVAEPLKTQIMHFSGRDLVPFGMKSTKTETSETILSHSLKTLALGPLFRRDIYPKHPRWTLYFL